MTAQPSKTERPATYEDANLLLRLYELRREEKLRKAREWFSKNFHVSNLEEFQKQYPPGSEENAYVRMVQSYWDMAASFVTSGVLHRELFMENSRELLFVWERVRDIVPAWREASKNPKIAGNLEAVANVMIEEEKRRGSYDAFQKMVRGIRA
jgi:L-rhamnose mutarotase